jgi:hypothetical protein
MLAGLDRLDPAVGQLRVERLIRNGVRSTFFLWSFAHFLASQENFTATILPALRLGVSSVASPVFDRHGERGGREGPPKYT